MNRYHQCMLTLCGDPNDETSEEGIAWVTCDQCKSWYHTVCVGFSEQFCMDQPFTCTCSNPPNSNGMWVTKQGPACFLMVTAYMHSLIDAKYYSLFWIEWWCYSLCIGCEITLSNTSSYRWCYWFLRTVRMTTIVILHDCAFLSLTNDQFNLIAPSCSAQLNILLWVLWVTQLWLKLMKVRSLKRKSQREHNSDFSLPLNVPLQTL